MSTPTVTVVMPAYNAARTIRDSLASIQQQTMHDLEVIVIDDGSSDATMAIVEEFRGSLDLTLLRQQNKGPSAARNAGIRKARGRYCSFLDADDLMLPQLLEKQRAMLDADPGMGMVITNISTFSEQKKDTGTRHWKFPTAEKALDRLLEENFVTTSAVMARTDRLLEAGLFPEDRRVAEDYELWMQLVSRSWMGIIDEPLVKYRYTSGSLSSNKLYSAGCALEVVEKFWNAHPDYRAQHGAAYRRSMARHLTNLGEAAAVKPDRLLAMKYLLRALRHEPAMVFTWKWLVKTIVLPADRLRARGGNWAAQAK
jgi:glycosyltransferase involved in cell wall biosynthesis